MPLIHFYTSDETYVKFKKLSKLKQDTIKANIRETFFEQVNENGNKK